LGTGTDTASSEGTVSNPEAEPGTNSGTESGQQAGTDSGTKPSEQPNTDPGEQPDTDPGTQSGSSGGESPENKSNDEVSTDSEALATLKSFYKYVTEGNYERAYDLFDDNFQSVSKMFMGFKISKAEITLELFQAFAEATQIFSNVKIEKVVKEEHTNDSYKIYYNQSIVIDPNKEPQVYPLVVTLKKMAGIWKITAVDDGTPGVEPF
jgi:hypothetical protein